MLPKMNLVVVLLLMIVPSTLPYEYNKTKFEFVRGVICNYDILPTITEQVVMRYYCVPENRCKPQRVRNPVMPQTDQFCNNYLTVPQYHEYLVCCHSGDITDNQTVTWITNKYYVPGLRSWLMCRVNAQAMCSKNGDNYCAKDFTNPGPIQGVPSEIAEYPHVALIGQKMNSEWNWKCLGSLISETFVLTAGKCTQKNNNLELFVKLGESRICLRCPDDPEEQIIRVKSVYKKGVDYLYYEDIGLLELEKSVQFNQFVRPACLQTDRSTRETQGWFARYSKKKTTIITRNTESPVFYLMTSLTNNNSLVSFRLQASDEVVLIFSNNGALLEPEKNVEVRLGMSSNRQSSIKKDNHMTVVNTDLILSGEEYRGFWIQLNSTYIAVGKESEHKPFIERNITKMDFLYVALGSPKGDAGWIFPDHYTLFALHDYELKVYFKDLCQRYFKTNTMLDKGGLMDDIMFCVGDLKSGKAPCDDDWGGAIQVMDDRHYCMWQIFGIFAMDVHRGENCSRSRLTVFNNIEAQLEWIENIVYKDFAVENISVGIPECTLPDAYRFNYNRC